MLRSKRNEYSEFTSEVVPMSDSNRQQKIRLEQTLEVEVLPNDTISSIALAQNCMPSDIKRLNKIDKDNEIFAFKVLKVPQNAQNVLIDTLPKVHKSSGSSSPKELSIVHSSSAEIEEKLEEKLLVASVSSAVISKQEDAMELETTVPLIDKTHFRGYPRMITGRHDYLSFNGSDCELNWIVLLIGILALCVVLPLVIFYLVYEHPEKFAHEHIRFDDPDIGHRQLHHLNDQHFASTSSDS